MMPCCRTLLLATITVFLLSSLPADKAFSEQPPAPENQPAPPKTIPEPKVPAQSAPPTQPEPPKLSTEPKAPSQSVPPAKPEGTAEREGKEKEKEAHKKPLRSLILTVKLALLADARLFHYEIEVGEDDQTITLGGRVSSEEEKMLATEVARSVPNVKAVVNKLEVDKGLMQALVKRQDDIITGLVKERFAKSATLKAANFDVKTEEGVVAISGAVRFQVIALEAAEAARQVPGVKAVKTEKVRLEGEG